MLDWVGTDQPMKMREISRAVDKKLLDNNNSGASARIESYAKDIDDRLLPVLRQKFGGVKMVIV